jgi:hypothetical protein
MPYHCSCRYHKYSDWEAAHVPGKDVVVPVFVSFGHFRKFGMHMSPLHPNFTYQKPRDQARRGRYLCLSAVYSRMREVLLQSV